MVFRSNHNAATPADYFACCYLLPFHITKALTVDGRTFKMTCVSMGNPHAITYSVDGKPIKV